MKPEEHWNEEDSGRVRFTISYQGVKSFFQWLKKKPKEKDKEETKA